MPTYPLHTTKSEHKARARGKWVPEGAQVSMGDSAVSTATRCQSAMPQGASAVDGDTQ